MLDWDRPLPEGTYLWVVDGRRGKGPTTKNKARMHTLFFRREGDGRRAATRVSTATRASSGARAMLRAPRRGIGNGVTP